MSHPCDLAMQSTDTTLPNVQAPEPPPKGPLPFGTTLHYSGCGCPASWQPGSRPAEQVDLAAYHAYKLFETKLLTPHRKLRVLYILPHQHVTGGMKCLCEHVRLLRARGHHVTAALRSGTAPSAMPPWSDVVADRDVVVRLDQHVHEVLAGHTVDVAVVGMFHQVAELLATLPCPVLYWEQGHEWLFGDPIRLLPSCGYLHQDHLFHLTMQLPVALACVSEVVRQILVQEFGRAALLVPNGVDCRLFTPGECEAWDVPADLVLGRKDVPRSHKSVLLVGNPSMALKGFDVALRTLKRVAAAIPLKVVWVCQQQPTPQDTPSLQDSQLDTHLYINPPQALVQRLYRGHDAFLFTSHYEAWGMPALEAMASGLPLVTTSCSGVTTFACHGINCLMAEPADVEGLAQALHTILTDTHLAPKLASAARQTALNFAPDLVSERLEGVLYSLVACGQQLVQLRCAAAEQVHHAVMWAAQTCSTDGNGQSQGH